jgi:hypothetical protein
MVNLLNLETHRRPNTPTATVTHTRRASGKGRREFDPSDDDSPSESGSSENNPVGNSSPDKFPDKQPVEEDKKPVDYKPSPTEGTARWESQSAFDLPPVVSPWTATAVVPAVSPWTASAVVPVAPSWAVGVEQPAEHPWPASVVVLAVPTSVVPGPEATQDDPDSAKSDPDSQEVDRQGADHRRADLPPEKPLCKRKAVFSSRSPERLNAQFPVEPLSWLNWKL